jgi:hypothetical protein
MTFCFDLHQWVVRIITITGSAVMLFLWSCWAVKLGGQSQEENQLTLYASFDKNVIADQSVGDETPLTSQSAKVIREGKKSGALSLEIGSILTYDAPGNVYAERGTLGLWWKLDEPLGRTPFPIVLVSQLRPGSSEYDFIRLLWTGEDLRLQVYDRDGKSHEIVSVSKTELVSGRWFHLAFTWDELEGLRLYVDGHESGRLAGELHLPHPLDQVGIHTSKVTPQALAGNERKVFIDELRIYSTALTPAAVESLSGLGSGRAEAVPSVSSLNPELWNQHWKTRFRWENIKSLPRLNSPGWLRKEAAVDLKGSRKRETGIVVIGSAAEKLARIPAASKLAFRLLPAKDALNLQGVSRAQIATLYNLRTKLLRSHLPEDQEAWIGVPAGLPASNSMPPNSHSELLHYCHVILPPYLSHTALDAVRLKWNPASQSGGGELSVHISIKDPVYFGRELFSADFRVAAVPVPEVVLDFPDIVVPANVALWLTIASDQKDFGTRFLSGAEAELWSSPTTAGAQSDQVRKEYLSDRLAWMRDSFRTLSRTSPWRNEDPAKLRRQSKAIDELMAVLEDVVRVDPKELTAAAYLRWVKPSALPPDFQQPSPSAGVPLWAFQQQLLIEQIKQLAEWWIKKHQDAGGGFGDGFDHDTHLAMNWPGIALMDGPGYPYRDSLLKLLKACESGGLLTEGFSALRGEPAKVYQQGLNLLPAAALLDYGNPFWIERLMESARHLERITALNPIGHRHFRSYLLSASDMVEEGYHAREDRHSALLWHPALALAWYNRNPLALRWLTEAADALLGHWQRDRYLKLSLGIRFFSDDVLSRGLPEPERVNLLWGVFRLSGDPKYLWLLDALNQGGEVTLAQTTAGRWPEFLENVEAYREGLLQSAREKNIWDRNLQDDETGLLARQYAFELTGSKRYVEDYQAALLKHLARNRLMFTEAEPFTGQVQIPHRALQRARLGGVAYHQSMIYPGHAISWEGANGRLAALTFKSNPHLIKLSVFNFAKTLLDVHLRVWDLENGIYTVIEGTDVTGHDNIDVETTRRTLPLGRGSAIPLSLRPQKTTVIEVRQQKKGLSLGELPDLGIGTEDLQYDPAGEKATLVVHNIGARKSPPFVLQVENEKRAVLLKKSMEALEAPTDLVPKKVKVELSGLRAGASQMLIFRIDPENQIEEITRDNNVLRKSLK